MDKEPNTGCPQPRRRPYLATWEWFLRKTVSPPRGFS